MSAYDFTFSVLKRRRNDLHIFHVVIFICFQVVLQLIIDFRHYSVADATDDKQLYADISMAHVYCYID